MTHEPFSDSDELFCTNLTEVVRRTAQVGLDDPDRAKWLLIWSCDVAGELGEIWELLADKLPHERMRFLCDIECGDVLWGISAVCLALDLPVEKVLQLANAEEHCWLETAMISACKILDQSKKVCRDGLDVRRPDIDLYAKNLAIVYRYVTSIADRQVALDAVDAKLKARYPSGFDAARSVSRQA